MFAVGHRCQRHDDDLPGATGAQGRRNSQRRRSCRADIVNEDYTRRYGIHEPEVSAWCDATRSGAKTCLVMHLAHPTDHAAGPAARQRPRDVRTTLTQASTGRRHPRAWPVARRSEHRLNLEPQQDRQVAHRRVMAGPLDAANRRGDHAVVPERRQRQRVLVEQAWPTVGQAQWCGREQTAPAQPTPWPPAGGAARGEQQFEHRVGHAVSIAHA